MKVKNSSCYRNVGETCRYCNRQCIKHGNYNGKQRYKCKSCNRTFIATYQYNACKPGISQWIQSLLKESCGIRSISRLLQISVTTVLKRIISIAKTIRKPLPALHKTYEVDEMRIFYKSKTRKLWIVYALRTGTGQVADFAVGTRTTKTLQRVIDTVLLSGAEKICTDKLHLYRYIIPSYIHCSKIYGTNHIERKNLNLRTHLKRLGRRTICYSKSIAVLIACLKIYFWS
ncbi:MAG TPA: IS1 family transposase [Hanamia sp.]|nr:IS1 family transposase [Hanamia sp.]